MSEKHAKETAVFVSDEGFIEGFHRTREGLHAFDTVDLDDLTRRGIEAYWRAREIAEPSVIDTAEAERETAILARKYAPRLGTATSLITGTAAVGLSALVMISLKWGKIWPFLVRSLRRVPAARALVK
jgi:hypothetical protein